MFVYMFDSRTSPAAPETTQPAEAVFERRRQDERLAGGFTPKLSAAADIQHRQPESPIAADILEVSMISRNSTAAQRLASSPAQRGEARDIDAETDGSAPQALGTLLRTISSRLAELDPTIDESGTAEIFCAVQASAEAWSNKISDRSQLVDSAQNRSQEAASPLEALLDQLAGFDQNGSIAMMITEFNALLARCEYSLRAATNNPLRDCPQGDRDSDCRASRKAKFSGRGIDCLDCGTSAKLAIGQSRPRRETPGEPQDKTQSTHRDAAWPMECAAYPETISRFLSANQPGTLLSPTMIAQWDQLGLLIACNTDSIASGRPAARSPRKMYLVRDVWLLWTDTNIYSII